MLALDAVTKRYGNGTLAVDGIGLAIGKGEIVGIVGGSGCGKSTLLRLMAGLEAPSQGTVTFGGAPLLAPRDEIGVVFQEPRLMPWLTVAENVAFGLGALPRAARAKKAADFLARVGLGHAAGHWPRELSGGMAQRVAIARALAPAPSVLLLDEPFGALDAFTRMALQDHLLELWSYEKPTLVLVTHDIDEALTLADRVVLLSGHPGRVRREFAIGLKRPRARTAAPLVAWKDEVMRELHLAAAVAPAPLRRAAPAQ